MEAKTAISPAFGSFGQQVNKARRSHISNQRHLLDCGKTYIRSPPRRLSRSSRICCRTAASAARTARPDTGNDHQNTH